MITLFRLAGTMTILTLAGLSAAPFVPSAPAPDIKGTAVTPAAAPEVTPLPSTDKAAVASLLERSPFTRDHAPFVRNPSASAHDVDVRLAGVFKIGNALRANLVIDGRTVVVGAGETTQAGSVAAIEPSAVVFDDGRRIELFKQPGTDS